jgi:hypothetical protein
MLSRAKYLKQGLPPIDPSTRATCCQVQDGTLLEEEDGCPAPVRTSGLLAAPIYIQIPSRLDDPRYNLNEIEKRASKIQPGVAPSVYPSDMPSYLPQTLRDSLYVRILALGVDFIRVSRMAVAHELTPPEIYWDKAVRDCIPIIESALMRNLAGEVSIPTEGIEALNSSFNFLEDQLSEASEMIGRSETCSSIAAIFLSEGSGHSTDDLEVLLGHFIAHARIGNRRCHQPDKRSA